MTPVKQDKFTPPDHSSKGNCFDACVASIMDLPLAEVPPFTQMGTNWFASFHKFAHEHGFELYGTGREATHGPIAEYEGVDGYVIVNGTSPRPWVKDGHAVIYKNGKLVHDPHPSNDGILSIEGWLLLERRRAEE